MPKVTPQYRAERRAHVMAAARRCFVRNGFHAASMADLVEESGMSSGAVYRYFPSKDAVIEAIAAENLEQVVTVIGQSIDQGADPPAAIASVLQFITRRHAEDGFAAIALLVWSEALRNPDLARHLREATTRAVGKMNTVERPAGVAELLSCVLSGYVMQLALGGLQSVHDVPTAVVQVFATSASPPAPSGTSA